MVIFAWSFSLICSWDRISMRKILSFSFFRYNLRGMYKIVREKKFVHKTNVQYCAMKYCAVKNSRIIQTRKLNLVLNLKK